MAERTVPSNPERWPARVGGLLVAAAILWFGYGYLQLQQEQQLLQQRQAVAEVAAAQAFTLQQQLVRSLSATYALATVLRQYRDIPDFAALAGDLIASYGGISNLQLAPGGVVSAIHPLAGNERALGHDLLNDPQRRDEALRAIDTRELTLAGPFELIQGGTAVIGRLPVFSNEDDFWGFAIALVRLPLLIDAADLGQLERAGLDYALWRIDPRSGARHEFARSRPLPLPEAEHVGFAVAGGRWTLAVMPHAGWVTPPLSREGQLLVLLAAGMAGLLVMTLLQRPAELRLQVARRRAELEAANRALHAEVEERDRVERALRWSEGRLRQFIEYAGDAIFLHDTHGQLLNVNREACQLLGYSRAELLALPLSRIALGFRLDTQQWADAALLPGTAVTFDERLRRVGREPCPVALKVAAFDCEGRRLYVTFARDISERLVADAALARTRDELEVRVSQRAAALEAANERLVREIAERREAEAALRTALGVAEEADAAKSRFLANLSHEIRAPMNGLLGMLNLLRDHPLSAEQRDYVATALHSGESLLQLLDDLLDLSRIEAGHMALDPVETELRPWLEAQLVGPRARSVARAIAFTCAVDPALPTWARFDAARLGQVLYNLLDNAIKFTPDGGTVALRLEATASAALRVVVRDTGVGIPQAAVGRIFDAFVQVEETLTRRHGGPGLGLAISSRLVDLMGGRIVVQSTVDAGSTFTFTLPLEACEALAEQAPGDRPDGHGAPTVLVAEDDHTSQQVALAMLQRLGCRTVLAGDGRAAVAAVTAGAFDLVLMDCRLPEMDGFSATAAIRRHEQVTGHRVPILGVSGDVDPATVAACRDAGMDGHLGKPLQLAMLRALLARWAPHWNPSG